MRFLLLYDFIKGLKPAEPPARQLTHRARRPATTGRGRRPRPRRSLEAPLHPEPLPQLRSASLPNTPRHFAGLASDARGPSGRHPPLHRPLGAGRTARARSGGAGGGAGGAAVVTRGGAHARGGCLAPPLALPLAAGLYGENMAPFPEEVDVFSAPHWRMKQLVGLYCDKVAEGGSLGPAALRRGGGFRQCAAVSAPAPAATSHRCRGAPRPFPPRVVPPPPPRPTPPSGPFKAGPGLTRLPAPGGV